jgi:hypothetical protein
MSVWTTDASQPSHSTPAAQVTIPDSGYIQMQNILETQASMGRTI